MAHRGASSRVRACLISVATFVVAAAQDPAQYHWELAGGPIIRGIPSIITLTIEPRSSDSPKPLTLNSGIDVALSIVQGQNCGGGAVADPSTMSVVPGGRSEDDTSARFRLSTSAFQNLNTVGNHTACVALFPPAATPTFSNVGLSVTVHGDSDVELIEFEGNTAAVRSGVAASARLAGIMDPADVDEPSVELHTGPSSSCAKDQQVTQAGAFTGSLSTTGIYGWYVVCVRFQGASRVLQLSQRFAIVPVVAQPPVSEPTELLANSPASVAVSVRDFVSQACLTNVAAKVSAGDDCPDSSVPHQLVGNAGASLDVPAVEGGTQAAVCFRLLSRNGVCDDFDDEYIDINARIRGIEMTVSGGTAPPPTDEQPQYTVAIESMRFEFVLDRADGRSLEDSRELYFGREDAECAQSNTIAGPYLVDPATGDMGCRNCIKESYSGARLCHVMDGVWQDTGLRLLVLNPSVTGQKAFTIDSDSSGTSIQLQISMDADELADTPLDGPPWNSTHSNIPTEKVRVIVYVPHLSSYGVLVRSSSSTGTVTLPLPDFPVTTNPAAAVIMEFQNRRGARVNYTLGGANTLRISGLLISFMKPPRAEEVFCVSSGFNCLAAGSKEDPTSVGAFSQREFAFTLQGNFGSNIFFALTRRQGNVSHDETCTALSVGLPERFRSVNTVLGSGQNTRITFQPAALPRPGEYTLCSLAVLTNPNWVATGFAVHAAFPPYFLGEVGVMLDRIPLTGAQGSETLFLGLNGASFEGTLWYGTNLSAVSDAEVAEDIEFARTLQVRIGFYPHHCHHPCNDQCRPHWTITELGTFLTSLSRSGDVIGGSHLHMEKPRTLQFLSPDRDMHMCAAVLPRSAGDRAFQEAHYLVPLHARIRTTRVHLAGYPGFTLETGGKKNVLLQLAGARQIIPLSTDTAIGRALDPAFAGEIEFVTTTTGCAADLQPGALSNVSVSLSRTLTVLPGIAEGEHDLCLRVNQPGYRHVRLVPWTESSIEVEVAAINSIAQVKEGRIGLPTTSRSDDDTDMSLNLAIETNYSTNGLRDGSLSPRFEDSQIGFYYLQTRAGTPVDGVPNIFVPTASSCAGISWQNATSVTNGGHGVLFDSSSATPRTVLFPQANLNVGSSFAVCVLVRPSSVSLEEWYILSGERLPWATLAVTVDILPFLEINGRRDSQALSVFAGLPARIVVCENDCIQPRSAGERMFMKFAPQGRCRDPPSSPWYPDAVTATFDDGSWYFTIPTYDDNGNHLQATGDLIDLCVGDNRTGAMEDANDFAVAFVKVDVRRIKLGEYEVATDGTESKAISIQLPSPTTLTTRLLVLVSSRFVKGTDFKTEDINWDRYPVWFSTRLEGTCRAPVGKAAQGQVSSTPVRPTDCGSALELANSEFATALTAGITIEVCIAAGSTDGKLSCAETTCRPPADMFFQPTGITYAVVQAQALQMVQSPSRHLYPSFGFGPPIVVSLTPAPVIDYLDQNNDRITSFDSAFAVLVEYYLCEMRGVDDCIRTCQSLKSDLARGSVADTLECTLRCEEKSLEQCATPEQIASGAKSPWPWASGWTPWTLETGEGSGEFSSNRAVTRVVGPDDYRNSNRHIVFGESAEYNSTAESAILVRSRFRAWYKLKFTVVGPAVSPTETEPFRLRACYDWTTIYNTTRFRSKFTSGVDSDNTFPTGASIASSMYAAPNQSQCIECPEGAVCDGSTEMRTDSRQGVGYWRADISSTVFYICDLTEGGAEGCIAGTATGTCSSSHSPHRWPFNSNPVCSLCADGYGKTNIAGRCAQCPEDWVSWIFAVLLVIVFLLLVLLMVVSNLRSSRENDKDEFSILIKMLLSHLQIIALIGIFFEKLGTIGRNLFGYSKQASGDSLGKMVALDCVWPWIDYYWKFEMIMALPFAFAAFAAILFGPVLAVAKKAVTKKLEKKRLRLEEMRKENQHKGFFTDKLPSAAKEIKPKPRKSRIVPADASPNSGMGERVETVASSPAGPAELTEVVSADDRAPSSPSQREPRPATAGTQGSDDFQAFTPRRFTTDRTEAEQNKCDDDAVVELFRAIDRGIDGSPGDGVMEKDELFNGLARIKREKKSMPQIWKTLQEHGLHLIDNMDELWRQLDATDQNGRVTLDEFRLALSTLKRSVRRTSDFFQGGAKQSSDSEETASDISEEGIDATLGFRVTSTEHMFRAYVASLVIFSFIVYPDLLLTCANMLSCSTFDWGGGGNRRVLKIDMSIDCDGNMYDSYKMWALALLVAYGCGLPLVFVLLHWKVQGSGLSLVHDKLDDNARKRLKNARYMFGFLTAGYKRETWYWEALIMVRKLMTVVIAQSGLLSSETLRSYLLMWTMMVFWVLQAQFRPYAFTRLNVLEERSIMVIIATVSMTLLYVQPEEPDNGAFIEEDKETIFYMFTLFILFINAALVLYFVYYLLYYLRQTVATALLKALVHDDMQYSKLMKVRPLMLVLWLFRRSRLPKCGGVVMFARDEETGHRVTDKGKPVLTLLNKQKFCGDMRGSDGKKGEPPPLKNILVLRRKSVGYDEADGFVKADGVSAGDHIRYVPKCDAEEEQNVVTAEVLKVTEDEVTMKIPKENRTITESVERFDTVGRAIRDAECGSSHPEIPLPEGETIQMYSVGARVVRGDDWTLKWDNPGAPFAEGNGGPRGAGMIDNGHVDVVLPHECPARLEWGQPGESRVLLAEPENATSMHRAWEETFHQPLWESKNGTRLFLLLDSDELERLKTMDTTPIAARWVLSGIMPDPEKSVTATLDQCEEGAWRSERFDYTRNASSDGSRMPHDPALHGRWERKKGSEWVKAMSTCECEATLRKGGGFLDTFGAELRGLRIITAAERSPIARCEVNLEWPEPRTVKLGELLQDGSGSWAVTGILAPVPIESDGDIGLHYRNTPSTLTVAFRGPSGELVAVSEEKKTEKSDLGNTIGITLIGVNVKTVHPGGPAAKAGVQVGMSLVEMKVWERIGAPDDIQRALALVGSGPVKAKISQTGPTALMNGVGTVVALDSRKRRIRVAWAKKVRKPQRNSEYNCTQWITDLAEYPFMHRFGGGAVGGRAALDVSPAPGFKPVPGSWRTVAHSDVIPSKGLTTVIAHLRWRSRLQEESDQLAHLLAEPAERMRVTVKQVHVSRFFAKKTVDDMDSARNPQSYIFYEESCMHAWGRRSCFPEPPRMDQAQFEAENECQLVTAGGDTIEEIIDYGLFEPIRKNLVDTHVGVRLAKAPTGWDNGLILKEINGIEVHKVSDIGDVLDEAQRDLLADYDSDDENAKAVVLEQLSLTLTKPMRKVIEGFGGQFTGSSDLLEATTAAESLSLAHVALEFQVWMPLNEPVVVISPLKFIQEYSAAVRRWAQMYRDKDPTLVQSYQTYEASDPGFQSLVIWETPTDGGGLMDQPPPPAALRRAKRQAAEGAVGGDDALAAMEQAQAEAEEEDEQRREGGGLEEGNPFEARVKQLEEEVLRLRDQNEGTVVQLRRPPFEYRPYPFPGNSGDDAAKQPWRVGCTSVDQVVEQDKEVFDALQQSLMAFVRQRVQLEEEIERFKEDAAKDTEEDVRREEEWAQREQHWKQERDSLMQASKLLDKEARDRGVLEAELKKSKEELKGLKKESQVAWEAEERSRNSNVELRELVEARDQSIKQLESRMQDILNEQARLAREAADKAEEGLRQAAAAEARMAEAEASTAARLAQEEAKRIADQAQRDAEAAAKAELDRRNRENEELRRRLEDMERERTEREAALERARQAEEQARQERAAAEAAAEERKQKGEQLVTSAMQLAGDGLDDDTDDSDAEDVPLHTRQPRQAAGPFGTSTVASATTQGRVGVATTLQEKLKEQDEELTRMLGRDWQRGVGKEGLMTGKPTPPPPQRGRRQSRAARFDDDERRRAYESEGGDYIPPSERARGRRQSRRQSGARRRSSQFR